MERYIILNIHTERLHDDKCWKRTRSILDFFSESKVRANWFVVNPAFVGYKAMGFDEKKWKERLKIISQKNQNIEQHTHFYKGKEGLAKGEGYDLGPENVLKRVREDRLWLENQGYKIKGFISGAWRINKDILRILAEEGYSYDLSINNLDLTKDVSVSEIGGLLEIPATSSIKRFFLDLLLLRPGLRFLDYKGVLICTMHFHDFDLQDFLNYLILKFLILIFKILNYKFIDVKSFYKAIKRQ